MTYISQDKYPTSEYQIIFKFDEVDEEDLLHVENQVTSSGYAKIDPESDYSKGVRTWHLDWKNHGDNPHEIIAKLKKFSPEIYKKIIVERITE
jgi:hypothetical protein